ncbi:NAD(P)/FAD-dependent oxidoreductase [Algoriphagus hitonicola]|uniref:Glycine/D-amino acid oxidase n=1 Tax=Algoriphagus hitonicola TaxID=435880 RepID=A0A1I2NZ51_9BACT|nr:FAD-dependent oxidoreductase [Algoriphagus hitonicola]SFG09255.1 Glycine/D-amino acid oxidase [Algoriphagus hitonicola]
METDFLLIGQGLAGTALGFRLKEAGKSVKVFDRPDLNQSSRVAAGLFNPVTGRKMVKTWNADALFPEIIPFYRQVEKLTSKKFLREQGIYRPFLSIEEQNEWMGHSADPSFSQYLSAIHQQSQSPNLHDPFGGVMLKNSGWLDINPLLDGMRGYFGEDLILDQIEASDFQQEDGHWIIKGIKANSIIFCNGLGAMKTDFFDFLPFAPVKGEILEVKQAFSPDYIVNRGVFRVHLGNDLHRVGSTYTWHDLDQGPTETAKKELTERLAGLVNLPIDDYISQKVGIRPATKDRKPFLGKHPERQNVYIFDGFGAKGVSLIPYYSKVMTSFLIRNIPLPREVDIARYFNYI